MDIAVIGHRIKFYRQRACITQSDLAKALGCTVQHIGAIERGIKTPRLDTFVTIANVLGVSTDMLLQDVLIVTVDEAAADFAAAAAKIPPETRIRLLRALRSFSMETD